VYRTGRAEFQDSDLFSGEPKMTFPIQRMTLAVLATLSISACAHEHGAHDHEHAAAAEGTQRATEAVASQHVGNIFIAGRTTAGSQATQKVISSFTSKVGPGTTHATPMLVATDQEGGEVQVLAGSGFSDIPSALDQSAQPRDQLVASARTWGKELADVGVNMNLAPVADLVDIARPASNEPIGRWGREYGHDADIEQRVEKRKLAAGKQPNARRVDVPVRIFVVAKGETSVFKSDRIRFASSEHVGCDDKRRTRRQIDRIRLRLYDAPVVKHAFERRRVEHE